MMRYFSSSAIVLLLALCGSVSAQQRLVLHNDQDDPCRRFKMRILIPADVDHQLPVKRFSGGIDSRMVWNPCSEATPQIAVVFPNPEPDRNDLLLPQLPFSFQRGTVEKNPRPAEFVLAPPRFTFPRIWRQP